MLAVLTFGAASWCVPDRRRLIFGISATAMDANTVAGRNVADDRHRTRPWIAVPTITRAVTGAIVPCWVDETDRVSVPAQNMAEPVIYLVENAPATGDGDVGAVFDTLELIDPANLCLAGAFRWWRHMPREDLLSSGAWRLPPHSSKASPVIMVGVSYACKVTEKPLHEPWSRRGKVEQNPG